MSFPAAPTLRLIARPPHDRYDRHNRNTPDLTGAGVDDRAELERRLAAGEWLSTGEVAVLLDTSRWTVIRIVDHGRVIDGVTYELGTRGIGRHRELDPADVTALIEARNRRHGAAGSAAD